jgi:2-keto-4-pentenoate hydratase
MTPQNILAHYDSAQLWPSATALNVAGAYQTALHMRSLRTARGEQPRGYKIGFTNSSIWPRYNVLPQSGVRCMTAPWCFVKAVQSYRSAPSANHA